MRWSILMLLVALPAAADVAIPGGPQHSWMPLDPPPRDLPLTAREACRLVDRAGEASLNARAGQLEGLRWLATTTPDDAPRKAERIHQLAEAYEAERDLEPTPRRRDLMTEAAVQELTRLADTPAFAGYPHLDGALAQLAWLHVEDDREEVARRFLFRLIKDYPTSPMIPEAYLAFGDHYYSEKSPAKALPFYEKVLRYPTGRCVAYARYKEGWVYRQLGETEKAMAAFSEVSLGKGHPSPELRHAARMEVLRLRGLDASPAQRGAAR